MTREVYAATPPADIAEKFPCARQIVAIRTTSTQRRPEAKPRKTEVHYYVVTGKPGRRRLSAPKLAAIIRAHWGIENRLHHRLDRTMREDDQKTRSENGAAILSLLRKIALVTIDTLLPKGPKRRYLPEIQAALTARPRRALKLLTARPA